MLHVCPSSFARTSALEIELCAVRRPYTLRTAHATSSGTWTGLVSPPACSPAHAQILAPSSPPSSLNPTHHPLRVYLPPIHRHTISRQAQHLAPSTPRCPRSGFAPSLRSAHSIKLTRRPPSWSPNCLPLQLHPLRVVYNLPHPSPSPSDPTRPGESTSPPSEVTTMDFIRKHEGPTPRALTL